MNNPKTEPTDNAQKDPDQWVSGDDPMTGAQASYLKTLCEQVGKPDAFNDKLSKADASKMIDEMREAGGGSRIMPEEPMITEAQRDELKTLCAKADVPDKSGELLTQDGAQKYIEELKKKYRRARLRWSVSRRVDWRSVIHRPSLRRRRISLPLIRPEFLTLNPTSALQRPKYPHQLLVHELVAAHHMAGDQRIDLALNIRNRAAGFADHDRRPRCPRAADCVPNSRRGGRRRRKRDRARPRRSGAGPRPWLHAAISWQRQLMIAAADMRQAAGDHAFVELARPATRRRWSLRNAPLPRSAMNRSSLAGL